MLHFTNTTAYAATLLQLAARLDPAHAAALRRPADVGVRWLVKAHPAARPVHRAGRRRARPRPRLPPPERDDGSQPPGHRPRLAYAGIGSDVGGKAARALALAAERAGGAGARRAGHGRRASGTPPATADRLAPERPGCPAALLRSDGEDGEGTTTSAPAAALLWRATGEPATSPTRATSSRDRRRPAELGRTPARSASPTSAARSGRRRSPTAAIAGLRVRAARRAGARGVARIAATSGVRASTARSASARPARAAAAPRSPASPRAPACTRRAAALADGGTRLAARPQPVGRELRGRARAVRGAAHPHHWASLHGPGRPVGAVVGGPTTRDDHPRAALGIPLPQPQPVQRPASSTRTTSRTT